MNLNDQSPMPFGKYKGTPMEEVPASYLLWLYDDMRTQGFHDNTEHRKAIFKYLEDSHSALCKECEDYDPKFKPSR